MKKWIVITACGYTQDDEMGDTEHCQMLGIYRAETALDAAEQCRQELTELGHVYEQITVYELVDTNKVTVTHGTFSNPDEE